jgi:hypothetical protein
MNLLDIGLPREGCAPGQGSAGVVPVPGRVAAGGWLLAVLSKSVHLSLSLESFPGSTTRAEGLAVEQVILILWETSQNSHWDISIENMVCAISSQVDLLWPVKKQSGIPCAGEITTPLKSHTLREPLISWFLPTRLRNIWPKRSALQVH